MSLTFSVYFPGNKLSKTGRPTGNAMERTAAAHPDHCFFNAKAFVNSEKAGLLAL
jgi:hypothetical protein